MQQVPMSNSTMPLYFIRASDETGEVLFRDDNADPYAFFKTGDGSFDFWRLTETHEKLSKADIDGMDFEILLPLRGNTAIKQSFKDWYEATFPNAVDPAPGLF
jgi:hypothetical protein